MKEFGVDVDRVLEPTDEYVSLSNGTIAAEPFRLRTDRHGFIVDPKSAWPTGDRVYLLGDSFIENSFIAEDRRLCENLTRLDRPLKNRRFVNAGYSGSTTLQLFNLLSNKIVNDSQATVMLVLPSNDILALGNDGGYWNSRDSRFSPVIPPVAGTVVGGDFIYNLNYLRMMLTAFARLASAFKFDLVLSTCPFVSTDYDKLGWFRRRHKTVAVYQDLMERRQSANDIVREVAEEEGVSLIDLNLILDNPKLFYDDVHLNEQGCLFAAKAIHSQIT